MDQPKSIPRAKRVPPPLVLQDSNFTQKHISFTPKRSHAEETEVFPCVEAGSWVAFAHDIDAWSSALSNYPVLQRKLADRSWTENKYVGLVGATRTKRGEDGEMATEIILLYVMPLHALDAGGGMPRHSIPLGCDPSPGERMPMQTTVLMPWKNAIQMTTRGVHLRITHFKESELRFDVDDVDLPRMESILTHDFNEYMATADEDLDLLEHPDLLVPSYIIPAVVWRDIRGSKIHPPDPHGFVREYHELRE